MDDTLRSSAYQSMFLIQNMRIVNAYELASCRIMSGERSFLNLFRDSRTPPDSIRVKLVTLIYFVAVQCPSLGTTWYSASCARNGYTWTARDLRLPRKASGSALSADRQTLDVFVVVKMLFRIPQQLIIVKIRKEDWVRCNNLHFFKDIDINVYLHLKISWEFQ